MHNNLYCNAGAPLSTTLELLTHYFMNSNPDRGESTPSLTAAMVLAKVPETSEFLAQPVTLPPVVEVKAKDPAQSGSFWDRLNASKAPEPSMPPAPMVETPIVAAASSGSFWDRLNASKSDTGAVPQADPVPMGPSTPAAPVPAAPRPVPAAVPAPGGSFWDRINAAKAPAVTSQPVPEPLPSATPLPAPRATANTSAVPAASGSFWERMNAAKSAATTGPDVAAPVKYAFTAPDGKGFNDRNEYRKYVFDTFYTFSCKSNQELRKIPGEITG
jgi:hypothetical protein